MLKTNPNLALLGVLLTLLSTPGTAQNRPPAIENLSCQLVPASGKVVIRYDLADKEEKKAKITLKISDDAGKTFLVNTEAAAGDLGFPVAAGRSKKIVWPYPGKRDSLRNYVVKLVADDLQPVNIQSLVDQVDSTRLKKQLMAVYGNRNHKNQPGLAHLDAVKQEIRNRFGQSGLTVKRQQFYHREYQAENIIGRKAGHDDEQKTYILCAHYDTQRESPGADDNASGVAGMLEAMRILSRYNFKHSLVFIGMDLEEAGLVGSKYYLFNGGVAPHEDIEGVVNFDMIGYASNAVNSQIIPDGFEQIFPEACKFVADDGYRGNFVINAADRYSSPLSRAFNESIRKYRIGLRQITLTADATGEIIPNLANSDHASFWEVGYKAMHVGDGGETRNVHLDTKNDTSRLINYAFMRKVTQATVGELAELAGIQHANVYYSPIAFPTPKKLTAR
ncbi:MAG: M28 family peptidase [Cytophagales bacterium]|nr:M28 family peptidase [Cytophagales bacterium]